MESGAPVRGMRVDVVVTDDHEGTVAYHDVWFDEAE
jgi:hypothetical protein